VASKVAKILSTPLDDIASLHLSYVMHGLVHHLTYKIYIRTDGNALQLLVQVYCLLQCDNGKEGGTEHGSVSRLTVEVSKLQ
jgi:hypothetical protein